MPTALPLTQRKLREASFFLHKLRELSHSANSASSEEPSFYLSAFLSAARSVTFVLESEQGDGYKARSEAWRATRSERELQILGQFTFARNRALKRDTPVVTLDPLDLEAMSRSSLPHALMYFLFEEDDMPFRQYREMNSSLRPGDPTTPLLPLCTEYEALLSELVRCFKESEG